MVQYLAHAKWEWELRELVADTFAKIWGTDASNMATSFDGFCYYDSRRNYEETSLKSWLHTDQSPSKNFKWCVQGVLNLLPSYEDDGGLIVIPDSHHHHCEFFWKRGKQGHNHNYYVLNDEEKSD